MAKSSTSTYSAPFRYRRPGEDVKAMFGAQTGNPSVVAGESAKAAKPAKSSAVKKKSASAPAGKSGKGAKAKPAKVAAGKQAKAKKPAAKR